MPSCSARGGGRKDPASPVSPMRPSVVSTTYASSSGHLGAQSHGLNSRGRRIAVPLSRHPERLATGRWPTFAGPDVQLLGALRNFRPTFFADHFRRPGHAGAPRPGRFNPTAGREDRRNALAESARVGSGLTECGPFELLYGGGRDPTRGTRRSARAERPAPLAYGCQPRRNIIRSIRSMGGVLS